MTATHQPKSSLLVRRLAFLATFFLATFAVGCAQNGAVVDLPPQQFRQQLDAESNAVLLDVRTPGEYQSGHLQGAKLINIQDRDFREQLAELPLDQPIYVYCAVGGRSSTAARMLRELGATQVYNLASGIQGWAGMGFPVQR